MKYNTMQPIMQKILNSDYQSTQENKLSNYSKHRILDFVKSTQFLKNNSNLPLSTHLHDIFPPRSTLQSTRSPGKLNFLIRRQFNILHAITWSLTQLKTPYLHSTSKLHSILLRLTRSRIAYLEMGMKQKEKKKNLRDKEKGQCGEDERENCKVRGVALCRHTNVNPSGRGGGQRVSGGQHPRGFSWPREWG